LKEYTKGGGQYKCAFIKKVISKKNRQERSTYSNDHVYNSFFGFFDYIVYTDKAHIDLISQAQGRVLREQGMQDNPENIEERLLLKGV
jgi:hypothetical protein